MDQIIHSSCCLCNCSFFFNIYFVISLIFLEILKVCLILRQLKQPKSFVMVFKVLDTHAILILYFRKMKPIVFLFFFFFFTYSDKTFVLTMWSVVMLLISAHKLLPHLVLTLFLKSLVCLMSAHTLLLRAQSSGGYRDLHDMCFSRAVYKPGGELGKIQVGGEENGLEGMCRSWETEKSLRFSSTCIV